MTPDLDAIEKDLADATTVLARNRIVRAVPALVARVRELEALVAGIIQNKHCADAAGPTWRTRAREALGGVVPPPEGGADADR